MHDFLTISPGLWLNASGEPAFLPDVHHFCGANTSHLATVLRYRAAIPLPEGARLVHFGEGLTALEKTSFCGREVFVKHEYLFPTGSYKDRGAAVMLSAAAHLGVSELFEDSSGNAGCAVAAYAAKAGIACTILVPVTASPAKIRQMEQYGARVEKIEGDRQAAADEALKRAHAQWFASHVYNPWFYEGTKLFAYELLEQCGAALPDEILFPVGNGTLLLGTFKGFRELRMAGFVDRIPRLSAVQAECCAPLSGKTEFRGTVAEGIAVSKPARFHQILHAVSQTGGNRYLVSEDSIKAARAEAAGRGYFVEFTSAAALAAIPQAGEGRRILVPLTGHGLKNNL
jgi:threonine synthase